MTRLAALLTAVLLSSACAAPSSRVPLGQVELAGMGITEEAYVFYPATHQAPMTGCVGAIASWRSSDLHITFVVEAPPEEALEHAAFYELHQGVICVPRVLEQERESTNVWLHDSEQRELYRGINWQLPNKRLQRTPLRGAAEPLSR